MRIIHVGGFAPHTEELSSLQSSLGHQAGTSPKVTEQLVEETPYDSVVHLHDLGQLLALDTATVKTIITERRWSLFASISSLSPLFPRVEIEKNQLNELKQSGVHFILTTTDAPEFIRSDSEIPYIPHPITPAEGLGEYIEVPPSSEINVLYIEPIDQAGLGEALHEITEALKGRGDKINLTVLPASACPGTSAELRTRLRTCDILVERADGRGHGILALEALACGRTILSGNPPDRRGLTPGLALSPILHTTPDILARRLEALCKEHRSMRDLYKRGRQYIEDFHSPAMVAGVLLKRYAQLSK